MSGNNTDGHPEPKGEDVSHVDPPSISNTDSMSDSVDEVSIQHTTNAILQLGEVRAEEDVVGAHLSATERPVLEGSGAPTFSLSLDSVVDPHTEEEASALKTARKALADAHARQHHGDILRWEGEVKLLDTYNLRMDVVKAVCRGVEYDDEGKLSFLGGTIENMTDFVVGHKGKTRSCITRKGKIASWVRNRESIQPMVSRAVEERRKRNQESGVAQAGVKKLTSHDDTTVMDAIDVVRWKKDDAGLNVGYVVEYETVGFDKVLQDIAPSLEDAPEALLAFGKIG